MVCGSNMWLLDDIESGSESNSNLEDFSFECEESDSEDDEEEAEECLIDDSWAHVLVSLSTTCLWKASTM